MTDDVKVTVYLPAALAAKVEEEARKQRRSRNAQIVTDLERAYDREPVKR